MWLSLLVAAGVFGYLMQRVCGSKSVRSSALISELAVHALQVMIHMFQAQSLLKSEDY